MNNPDYEILAAIHEMIERRLCEKAGITEKVIDTWRLLHEDEDESGARSDCPYRKQHVIAEAFEQALAKELGVDWVQYGMATEDAIDVKVAVGLRKPKPPQYDKKPSRHAVSNQIKRILQGDEHGNETTRE